MKNKYIYLCGPTVYNKVHIGNMRPIVTFDLLLRAMKFIDPNIKLIHNITDIDDKIIRRAKEEQKTEEEISKKYTKFYLDMLDKFNVKTIDFMPKVSEKINVICDFVLMLSNKNFVYESNGSYYFKTSKLASYGELSNNTLDKLQPEESNEDKENKFDFALWKNKTNGKVWETKLGKGRPGWHTECAAFIYEITNGDSLIIHGGGIDLKFPHHENENAQFKALTNKSICDKWLHIGIINYKNQKMSKSLGNILFADEFIDMYKNRTNSEDLFRLMILSSSINATLEISEELIEPLIKKNNQIEKIINYVLLNDFDIKDKYHNKQIINDLSNGKFSNVYKELNELIKEYNGKKIDEKAIEIFQLISFLGFNVANKKISNDIKNIYSEWKNELKNKNYEKADKLRKQLIDNNII